MSDEPCPVCGRSRDRWPMIFKGDRACTVNCQKALSGEQPIPVALSP